MSTQDTYGGRDAPDDDVLAAEYVLHLLDPDSRAIVSRRLEIDGSLRAMVVDWTERLVPLADNIKAVTPPDGLRDRLRTITADDRATTQPRVASGRRFSLGALLGGGFAAALLALLAVFFLPQIQSPLGDPVYVADVEAPERQLIVQASYDTAADTLTVRREGGEAPEGRVLQVWLLTEDQPPHAIGTFADDDEVTVPVTPFWGERIPSGQFAVSEEPPGGSTDETGPRGEILAVGDVQQP